VGLIFCAFLPISFFCFYLKLHFMTIGLIILFLGRSLVYFVPHLSGILDQFFFVGAHSLLT
jgi:hypothetical protein